jgi:hypothetical protein
MTASIWPYNKHGHNSRGNASFLRRVRKPGKEDLGERAEKATRAVKEVPFLLTEKPTPLILSAIPTRTFQLVGIPLNGLLELHAQAVAAVFIATAPTATKAMDRRVKVEAKVGNLTALQHS